MAMYRSLLCLVALALIVYRGKNFYLLIVYAQC